MFGGHHAVRVPVCRSTIIGKEQPGRWRIGRVGRVIAAQRELVDVKFGEVTCGTTADLRYMWRRTSLPPQPLPCTVLMSYSATMAIGVWVGSTSEQPTTAQGNEARRPEASIIGQIGAVSGWTPSTWTLPDSAWCTWLKVQRRGWIESIRVGRVVHVEAFE